MIVGTGISYTEDAYRITSMSHSPAILKPAILKPAISKSAISKPMRIKCQHFSKRKLKPYTYVFKNFSEGDTRNKQYIYCQIVKRPLRRPIAQKKNNTLFGLSDQTEYTVVQEELVFVYIVVNNN